MSYKGTPWMAEMPDESGASKSIQEQEMNVRREKGS